MKPNPFCQSDAPAWLIEGQNPRHGTPPNHTWDPLVSLLEFREYAGFIPGLSDVVYETLPWLKGMHVHSLLLERRWQTTSSEFQDLPLSPSPSPQDTLTAFFADVTQPAAEMIEKLYTSSLLLSVLTIAEIMHRMAQSVHATPLPFEVVIGVCCSLWHRRVSLLSGYPIEVLDTTWRVSWRQISVPVHTTHLHTTQETQTPFLVLVNDETTGKVLAFRSTQGLPSEADILFTLSDALVFPYYDKDRWRLHPPAHLRVQRPVPSMIVRAAKLWSIKIEEVEGGEVAGSTEAAGAAGAVAPPLASFLRQWEQVIEGRVFNLMQYIRIFDRACERALGYAPFLAKRRVVQRIGLEMSLDDDPTWRLPSLRELLPIYPATVGTDGTLSWKGWHYRDMDNDLLRYWPNETVLLRPSPVNEAMIWVYWPNKKSQDEEILCCAIAEELHHKNGGSYRPYFLPYPRLGE
jgi:hypothetical protein